jgi:hypothetical protein
MITCSTLGKMGRIGNQMFQYATLYGIAKQNNYDFGVPYSRVNSSDEFAKFHLPEIFSLSAKDSSEIPVTKVFQEKQHHFDPNVLNISDNTDIFGYFQTEKYFINVREEIKKEFSFSEKTKNFCNSFKKSLPNKKIISIHVRRGDYLKIPHILPPCSISYYQEAVNYFDDDSSFLIFSDDVPWCMKNFKDDKYLFFQNNHYTSLCMMSLCDGHIISNSSYGWWGAWLGNVGNVIAPKNWFGPHEPRNWQDIYCDKWIII